MPDYFLAPALVTLRDEVNTRFPNRDKASDGWIGDPSHAARKSDHNPDWTSLPPGVVRALDLDISPDGRPDIDLRTALLSAVIGDPRVWYVISNSRIYSRTYGWVPRVYTGTNPHTAHVHVSLRGADGLTREQAAAVASDTSSWFTDTPGATLPAVRLHRVIEASRKPRREEAPVNVRRVQRALNARTPHALTVDGIYGQRTRDAVRWFQRSLGYKGADADGILGRSSGMALGAGRFRLLP